MPKFEIFGKDGKKYIIEADDIQTALDGVDSISKRNYKDTTRAVAGTILSKVPLAGPYMNKSAASMRSVVGPYLGIGDQSETYEDRYKNNLSNIESLLSGFKEDNPKTAWGLGTAGAVAGSVPFVMGMGALTGPALGANVLGQGVLGAGLSIGDKIAEEHASGKLDEFIKNPNATRELLKRGTIGGAFGTGGALLSRAITPGTIVNNPTFFRDSRKIASQLAQEDRVAQSLAALSGKPFTPRTAQELAETAMSNAPKQHFKPPPINDDVLGGPMMQAGLGGITGFMTGDLMHALGASVGAHLLREPIKGLIGGWKNNKVLLEAGRGHFDTADILKALAQGAGQEISDRN